MRKWAGIVSALLLMITISSLSLWWPPTPVYAWTTTEYNSTTSDGWLVHNEAPGTPTWDEVRDNTTATSHDDSANYVMVESSDDVALGFIIARGAVYIDTSGLPDDAYIYAAELHLYVVDVEDDDAGVWLCIQSGAPTFPSDPMVNGDYDRTNYGTTKYGDIAFASLSDGAWTSITLTGPGLALISKTGTTKLMLRTDYDIDDIEPGFDENFVQFTSADAGSNQPHLSIQYCVIPTVTSAAATSVSTTTATGNGEITATGGENNDYRGIAYGKTSQADPGNVSPVTTNPYDTYVIDGPGSWGTGTFTGSLVGLDTNTVYYYRSFTHNSAGWDYSNTEQNFHTLELPAITIGAASSITNTTATLPGNITDAGYPNPTVTVYWGDNDGVTTPGNWDFSSAPTTPAQPQGVAAFSKDVTSLAPGVTYFFRAAATNTAGTVWAAATLSFATTDIYPTVTTQAATDVINVSVTLNGNITNVGGDPTCDYRGFAWDNVTHGDPGDVSPATCGYDGPPGLGYYTYSGSYGTGAFTYSLAGLTQNTSYYYRAYAHNSSGWAYGAEVSFTTEGVPSVTTSAASGTTTTTTVLNGDITSLNGDTVTTRGFDYGPTDAYGSAWTEAGSFGTGAFSSATLLGFTPGTHYHYRAKATNTYGYGYGADTTVTLCPEDPTNLNTGAVTYTTVELTWTPGAHAAQSMLRYSTVDYPATPASGSEGYFNTGATVTLNSLTPGATYYFCVWSWVSGSDVWSLGKAQTNVTLPIPNPESLKAQAIDANTVNLWWLVPDNMTSIPTVSTIIHYKVGDYPNPAPSDTEIYDELTGAEGVKNFIWTGASGGTPYFFALWFYNSATGVYTDPVYAVCTTPAGFGGVTYPGGSGYFDPPTDVNQGNNPLEGVVGAGADYWGFQHGIMWAFLLMMAAVLVGMGLVIYSKSGVICTFGMLAVMVTGGIMEICPYWACIPFVILGMSMSWVAAKSYG